MNDGSDVSVIIQGPIIGSPGDTPETQLTRRAAESVRTVWPRCEIILSTWKGSDATGIPCDRAILSDDPGGTPQNDAPKPVLNNLNRQIVSTRAGLAAATRRFAVKLRSDCLLERPFDFAFLDSGPRLPEWSLFEKPVAALTVYTRHPFRRPVLFHVSDLFLAGLASDLRTYWSAPLPVEPAFTRHLERVGRPAITPYPEHDYRMRCAAEQYLAEQLTRHRAPDLHLRHMADGSVAELFLSLRVLANNFKLLAPAAAGVRLPARMTGHELLPDLFQPADVSALEQIWTLLQVPWRVRFAAAQQFLGARHTYTASHWLNRQPSFIRRSVVLLESLLALFRAPDAAPFSSPAPTILA